MPEPTVTPGNTRIVRPSTTPPGAEGVQAWLVSFLAARLRAEVAGISVNVPLAVYGVDSLLAVEFSQQIEKEFGVSFHVLNFLDGYTVARLAAELSPRLRTPFIFQASVAAPQPGMFIEHPLSEGQKAFRSQHNAATENAAHNLVCVLNIHSELDVEALGNALQLLSQRHAALRTSFRRSQAGIVQRIEKEVEFRLEVNDTSTWSSELLNTHLEMEAQRPFNLERGHLWRAAIYTTRPRQHILLLSAHRIVADQWSLAVLLHELTLLYEADINSTPASLPPLPLEFTNHVRHEAEMLAGPEGERLWNYWREQTGGGLPTLNLPGSRTFLPAHNGYDCASHSFKLEAQSFRSLKKFSRDAGATLFSTLLTTFQVLLSRSAGLEDIAVGTLAAGRASAAFAGVVGCFENPVFIRANLSGDPTFEAVLGQTQQRTLDAVEHGAYPFVRLAEKAQLRHAPGRLTPLQTMFILLKSPLAAEPRLAGLMLCEGGARVELGGLQLESARLEKRASPFDLAFVAAEVEGELLVSLQYNTDLFERATIERMGGHYRTLLDAALARPHLRICDLPLLTERERGQLLNDWNDTQRPYAQGANALSLFEERAAEQPQALAVSFEDEQLTYSELNARANRLACHLRQLGVRRETYVGICLERSTELVVGILATLKAGGVFVPLDPRYPLERTAFMLQDSGARILLTQESLATRWSEPGMQVICLDRDRSVISRHAVDDLDHEAAGDNLAYIIYTSGSSGAPKGAMITHDSLSHYVSFMREPLGLRPDDVYLHTASFAFSSSVRQLMLPLAHGASVVIASTERILNPLAIFDYVKRHRVTIMDVVPSYWRNITHALVSLSAADRSALLDNKLRLILSASEPLLSDVPRMWSSKCRPEPGLINMYGQTETTGIVATYPIPDPLREGVEAVPLGRPIANTRFYLLNERLEPVPVGITGQLYISSPGLARGYLNQPGLTAERFIPDPFSLDAGARLYRTGDLARYLPCGNLEYVGRADEQVKFRGHRVELREVKSALSRHPSVREALVTVRDVGDHQRLIGYVVPEAEVTAGELRRYLRDQLPEYMIPSAIMLLESFPLSANGKIDRRSLPAPDRRTLLTDKEYAAPRNPTEEMVAAIWSEVLGIERAGIHDNFFELGGDSLLAMQASYRVHAAAGVDVLLHKLFEAPTVAGLSEQIEAAKNAGQELMPERIPHIAGED